MKQTRLEALRLAVAEGTHTGVDTLPRAEAFAKFIEKGLEPVTSPPGRKRRQREQKTVAE